MFKPACDTTPRGTNNNKYLFHKYNMTLKYFQTKSEINTEKITNSSAIFVNKQGCHFVFMLGQNIYIQIVLYLQHGTKILKSTVDTRAALDIFLIKNVWSDHTYKIRLTLSLTRRQQGPRTH